MKCKDEVMYALMTFIMEQFAAYMGAPHVHELRAGWACSPPFNPNGDIVFTLTVKMQIKCKEFKYFSAGEAEANTPGKKFAECRDEESIPGSLFTKSEICW